MGTNRFTHNRWVAFLTIALLPLLLSSHQGPAKTPLVNHVRNAQFLLGTCNWRARYWQVAKLDYLLTEEIPLRAASGPDGSSLVVAIDDQPTQSVKIMSDLFPIRAGAPYQVDLEARAEEAGRSIEVVVFNEKYKNSKPTVIGTAWQTFSFNGLFPPGIPEGCRAEIRTSGKKGVIHLRRVTVKQADAGEPNFEQAECSLRARNPLALSELGDDVIFDLFSSGPSFPISLKWDMKDETGRVVEAGVRELPKGTRHTPLSLGKPGVGWYTLHCRFSGPGMTTLQERHNLAILPRVADRNPVPLEQSRFGMHIELSREGMLAARLMGARWVRLHSPLITKWHAIEEVQGKPSYRDGAIAKLTQQGFGIVGSLDRTPKWASLGQNDPKTPGTNYYGAYAYTPKDWSGWDRYVKDVVSRYKKDIHYWQVWNEPDIPFLVPPAGMSNASAYDAIVRRTVPLVKAANPAAEVIGGVAYLKPRSAGPGRQLDFPQEFTRLGTATMLDVFTFHHYISPRTPAPEIFSDLADSKRTLNRPGLRWWITEFGFAPADNGRVLALKKEEPTADILQMAKQAVQFEVSAFAQGVERIFYYNAFFDTNGFEGFRNDVNVMWDAREPNPIVATYAVMTWLLDGTRFEGATEKNGVKTFTFKNASQSIRVVWADHPGADRYDGGPKATIRNIWGRIVSTGNSFTPSETPTYVISVN